MRTSKMQLLAGALVLAALLAVSGVSQASCGSSKRVSYQNTSCLTANYDNNKTCTWGICQYYSNYWARSNCSGKVVAKIDIKNAADRTWHFTSSGYTREGSSSNNHVNGIYCCKDLSDDNNCRS